MSLFVLISTVYFHDGAVIVVQAAPDTIQLVPRIVFEGLLNDFDEFVAVSAVGLHFVHSGLKGMKEPQIVDIQVGTLRRLCENLDGPPISTPSLLKLGYGVVSSVRAGSILFRCASNFRVWRPERVRLSIWSAQNFHRLSL